VVVLMVGTWSLRGEAIANVASEAAKARMEKRIFDMGIVRLLLKIVLYWRFEVRFGFDGKVCSGGR
jgi:hypothetical protein